MPPSPFSDPSKATAKKDVLAHLGPAKEGDDKTFQLIEEQLEQQIGVCKVNGETYQKLGNLAASSQHKNMADQCQRDLLAIKGIRSQVRERESDRERDGLSCTYQFIEPSSTQVHNGSKRVYHSP